MDNQLAKHCIRVGAIRTVAQARMATLPYLGLHLPVAWNLGQISNLPSNKYYAVEYYIQVELVGQT